MPIEHSGIGGSMRFVARRATLRPHGRMLERERATFIAVALEASGLIRSERLRHRLAHRAVRIVAVHAGHLIFRHLVAEWLRELRLHALMASGTKCVHLRGGSRD